MYSNIKWQQQQERDGMIPAAINQQMMMPTSGNVQMMPVKPVNRFLTGPLSSAIMRPNRSMNDLVTIDEPISEFERHASNPQTVSRPPPRSVSFEPLSSISDMLSQLSMESQGEQLSPVDPGIPDPFGNDDGVTYPPSNVSNNEFNRTWSYSTPDIHDVRADDFRSKPGM